MERETMLHDQLFARLATRCRLVLLSNTDPLHVEHMEANYRFPSYFHARVYSCTAGASKPDPAIFRRAIEESCAAPGRILYVDDAEEYVAAGRRLGLRGYLFQSPEELQAGFRRRRILQPYARPLRRKDTRHVKIAVCRLPDGNLMSPILW